MSGQFPARFPGRCGACDEAIRPGQSVRFEDTDLIHADCEASAPDERPVVICTTCRLTMPCGCEDPS